MKKEKSTGKRLDVTTKDVNGLYPIALLCKEFLVSE